MRSMGRLLTIAVLACAPVGLPAQNATCVAGQLVPYFGWDGTECTNCVMRGGFTEYLKEPSIVSIRSDGPAAGRLREHDTILAVDGFAITTPEAWNRMHDAKSGDSVRFTVRNEGVVRDETIRPTARCVPVPPGERAPRVIVVRRKGMV